MKKLLQGLLKIRQEEKKLHPASLEIELFCKGLRIDSSCELEKDGRAFSRTRAGLGDGLELILPAKEKDIYLNAPVFEDFAKNSPYLLYKENENYFILDEKNKIIYPVKLPKTPSWYSKKTKRGIPMNQIGVLQGTYLGIYLGKTCKFWKISPALNCKFCTTGLNVGEREVEEKTVEDVLEVALEAKKENNITFVHFNSGWQDGFDLDVPVEYVKALKREVGVFIGLQAIPEKRNGFKKYDFLKKIGVNHFSFCYEFHNPLYFKEICPGKNKFITQKAFFEALEYTSKLMGKGKVSGEIIAGIEPIEDTLRAIDYITSIGAFPTVCIFRPLPGSKMENHPSPSAEEMLKVFKHLYYSMRKNNIPMGIIPNIEVSLVVNPDDTKYLVEKDLKWYLYDFELKILKVLLKPWIKKEIKPKKYIS